MFCPSSLLGYPVLRSPLSILRTHRTLTTGAITSQSTTALDALTTLCSRYAIIRVIRPTTASEASMTNSNFLRCGLIILRAFVQLSGLCSAQCSFSLLSPVFRLSFPEPLVGLNMNRCHLQLERHALTAPIARWELTSCDAGYIVAPTGVQSIVGYRIDSRLEHLVTGLEGLGHWVGSSLCLR
jgi:hypothetical protein